MINKPKKVLMWVHPMFKSDMKVCAAKNNVSVIQLSKRMAIDKKIIVEEEAKDDDIIRY